MLLAYWNSAWLEGDFDPTTGRVNSRYCFSKDRASSGNGYYSHEGIGLRGRTTFAIYRDGTSKIFQAGCKKWDLDSQRLSLRFKTAESGLHSNFEVFEAGNIVFSFRYAHPLRTLMARVDSTYDGLDFQHDHFLSHVTCLARPRAK